MNNIPTMMLTTGFRTDQNGALEEVVIPSTVTTFAEPTAITIAATSVSWYPWTKSKLTTLTLANKNVISDLNFSGYTALITLNIPYAQTLTSRTSQGSFRGCTALTNINAPELLTINNNGNGDQGSTTNGMFGKCTSLVSVTFPKLQTINNNSNNYLAGLFVNCTSLETFTANELITISNINSANNSGGVFCGCTALKYVNCNKLQYIYNTGGSASNGVFNNCTQLANVVFPCAKELTSGNAGAFANCAGLTTVQLGSEGHPVTSIGSNTFLNCTQSGLTITVYTTGGASLSGEPWGATNADIEYEEA